MGIKSLFQLFILIGGNCSAVRGITPSVSSMLSNGSHDEHSFSSDPPSEASVPSNGAKKAAAFKKRGRKLISRVRKTGRKVRKPATAIDAASRDSLDPHQSIQDDSYESSQYPEEVQQAPISLPPPPPQPLEAGGI